MPHTNMHRPHRVLALTDSLDNGGAERQLALLLQHLPDEWERGVWCPADGPFAVVLRDAGVPVWTHRRAWAADPRPAFDLWGILRRFRPDVVHSWGWMGTAAAAPWCRMLGIPIVDGSIRAGYVPSRRSVPARLALRVATCVIANSKAGLAAWGVAPTRGRVVYNGFAFERLREKESARRPGPPCTAVMTGRMSWEKDFDTFLAAARRLAAEDPNGWRFLAIGDGPDRARLERAAADLVASGIVAFAQPGIEVLALVQSADIGVLMSHPRHAEGCSNSIMEYMACGLPVVCSDSGGNRELVLDGVTGCIIASGDARALVDRLRQWRADPATAGRQGASGKARILQEFSLQRMVHDTLSVYDEAMRVTRPRFHASATGEDAA